MNLKFLQKHVVQVKSSLFYRNIQNAQKETAKDNSSPSQLYLYSITLNNNNKRNFR